MTSEQANEYIVEMENIINDLTGNLPKGKGKFTNILTELKETYDKIKEEKKNPGHILGSLVYREDFSKIMLTLKVYFDSVYEKIDNITEEATKFAKQDKKELDIKDLYKVQNALHVTVRLKQLKGCLSKYMDKIAVMIQDLNLIDDQTDHTKDDEPDAKPDIKDSDKVESKNGEMPELILNTATGPMKNMMLEVLDRSVKAIKKDIKEYEEIAEILFESTSEDPDIEIRRGVIVANLHKKIKAMKLAKKDTKQKIKTLERG